MHVLEKAISREIDEILGDGLQERKLEMGSEEGFGKRLGMLNIDLNKLPDGSDDGLGFQLGVNFLEKQIEKDQSVHSEEAYFRSVETDPDDEERGSSSKRRRYSAQEKGKAKIKSLIDLTEEEEIMKRFLRSQLSLLPTQIEHELAASSDSDSNPEKEVTEINHFSQFHRNQWILTQERREERRKERKEVARYHANRLAHPPEDEDFESIKQEKKVILKEIDEESHDLAGPFYEAMEMIKKRNSSPSGENKSSDFKWVPVKDKGFNGLKCSVPSLLDLSLIALAKNAEAIVSLEHVPDSLRHKLSQLVCDDRKMDAHFLQLLASGAPTQIRVNDCSEMEVDDFTKIFGDCKTKHLTVLQLDHCGRSLPDDVLCDTLARSNHSLPALVTISLRAAYRLTDNGLSILAASAPALQSVNVSQCPLLTSSGISALVSCLESTLRELYTDQCHGIDAMAMLPALKELKYLEVLSVAGIGTVCDDFVIEIVKAHGIILKELVLADCVELTDIALKFVGQKCSRLRALDLSCLHNLTDLTMQYLANGCRSVHSLKLCRNSFSDEAIAAFLEVSGGSLRELSLNNIRGVGLSTALSLAKCSRNLLILDLSWCRRLTDDALEFIVDNCLSLRLLKLFGCTQITDVFLNGHSSSMLRIIGLKLTPVLKHLNELEAQQTPLRYPFTFHC